MSALQSAVDEFLAEVKSRDHASVNTYLAYRSDLNQMVTYLQSASPDARSWDGINRSHMDGYITHLYQGTYGAATVVRKIAAAKAFFRAISDRSVIPENPLRRMKLPKLDKHAPFTLSEADVNRLIAATGTSSLPRAMRDRALLAVIYGTGMRVSELIALKVGDVNVADGWINCVTRLSRTRRIPLNREAVQFVGDYITNARPAFIGIEPTEIVFLNPSGGGLTRQAVWMLIRNYARAAGITGSVTPHTLRHSRAAHMLDAGEDVRRVKEWLGHANLSTTQAYGAHAQPASAPNGATNFQFQTD